MYELYKKRWYVIQAFSGFERKVAQSVREYIKIYDMKKWFGEIMVPIEEVVEIKGNKRRKRERKFFPGYVLVQMIMNDMSWHLVRSVPNVMGFIGSSFGRSSPISEKEMKNIMNHVQKLVEKKRKKKNIELSERVRINEGPFYDFKGVVEEIDYEKNRIKVSVSIFGRSTPVELDFHQIEKME